LTESNLTLRRELETFKEQADRAQKDLNRRLERALAAENAAEAALAHKAEVLAHMSHELRTPMNGILGMTQLVLQTDLSDSQREYIEVVQSSANALLTLINDILDLSKLDAGRLSLEAIPFTLADTVNNTAKSLSPLADERNSRIEIAIAAEVPDVVIGDPGRLRQLLLNLMGNAIKFTEDGSVTVSIAAVTSSPDDILLKFSISDTGIGIPPDQIDSIFEPYLQASSSISREYGGTGLGLAICHDLVDLMQGEIWVESVLGKGSTFHFTSHFEVPADDGHRSMASVDDLANLIVYILADEAPAQALAHQMQSSDSRSSLFQNRARLEQAVGEQKPDVVIVDLDQHNFSAVSTLDRTILDIAAYLTRPLGPLDLRDAVRGIMSGTEELITRHWLREHRPRLRILVADDSSSNRLVISQMLELQEHELVLVENGVEAVAAYKPDRFDIILLDMEMPVMSGVEAAKAIRQMGATLPILALSGHSSPEQIQKCRDAGMDENLTKPFKFDELVDTIERLVSETFD
jgi:signal transduction histidine kinase/CheY-like chemotaxis protein